MAAFDEKNIGKIIIREEIRKAKRGPACVFSYPGRGTNRHFLSFHFEIINEIIVGFRYDSKGIQIPVRLNNADDFLYYLAKIFQYSHDEKTVFSIESQLPPLSKWIHYVPDEGLYILLCPDGNSKLIPYDSSVLLMHGPQNLEEDEEEQHLSDECKKYHAVFYNVKRSPPTFRMKFHTEIIPEREYSTHNFNWLKCNTHDTTPKTFDKFLTMICFEFSIPDGSEFIFSDAFDDDDTLFRKMLPRKAKFHLEKGVIEVIEKFL